MYLRKHISRLSLYFWKPKKSEKIVFKKFLSYFMPFSLYIKVHHRCSEKMLENSEFFHREYLIFFDQKCFLVEISLFKQKKTRKKIPFQKSGWVSMDSPNNIEISKKREKGKKYFTLTVPIKCLGRRIISQIPSETLLIRNKSN